MNSHIKPRCGICRHYKDLHTTEKNGRQYEGRCTKLDFGTDRVRLRCGGDDFELIPDKKTAK